MVLCGADSLCLCRRHRTLLRKPGLAVGFFIALLSASLSTPSESAEAPLAPGDLQGDLAAVADVGVLPGLDAKPLFDFDFPYKRLVPRVTGYCYKALVANPDCCLDERFALGVSRHTLRRPDTSWACIDETSCWDTVRGYRGDDAIWVPDGAKCSAPRILYIHGGSWMYGSPDSLGYGQLASKLAALSGAVVMLPDIPLLPIANYSGWIKASLAALQYLVSNDPPGCSGPDGHEAPIFIGGDSAGGGTALSLMLELNMNPFLLPNGKRLSGGFFFSPWTNLMCNTPEYYNHAFAKIVDRKSFKGSGEGESDGSVYVGDIMFHGKPNSNAGGFQLNSWEYVGSRKLLTDPVASPMYAQRKEIEGVGGGLPPLYFATGGSESILGDSVIFAQKAARFGVKIRMDIFEGMWHVFPMYSEGCGLGEALAPGVIALDRTAQHVRHLALYGKPFFQTAPGIPYTHHEYDHTMENREQWWGPDDAESWPAGPSDAAVEKSSSADDLKQRRKKDEAQASEEAKQKHNDEVKARDEEEREAKDEVHHTHSGPGAKSNGEAKDESRKDAESKGHVTPQFPTADPQSGNNAAGLELLAAAMLGSFSTLMAVMVLLAFTPSTLVARAMKAAGLTGNDAVGSHLCSTTAAMPLLSGHAVGSP